MGNNKRHSLESSFILAIALVWGVFEYHLWEEKDVFLFASAILLLNTIVLFIFDSFEPLFVTFFFRILSLISFIRSPTPKNKTNNKNININNINVKGNQNRKNQTDKNKKIN